jgi:hypothetical protein
MERAELELLDSLLHKLRQDKHIMEGLSLLEQQSRPSSLHRRPFVRSFGNTANRPLRLQGQRHDCIRDDFAG